MQKYQHEIYTTKTIDLICIYDLVVCIENKLEKWNKSNVHWSYKLNLMTSRLLTMSKGDFKFNFEPWCPPSY